MTITVNFLPEAAAAVFGIVLCVCLRHKYADATEANVYYRQMAYAVTAATIADVVSTAIQVFVPYAPPTLLLFNTTLFYLATVIAAYLLLRYITMCANRQESRYFSFQKYLLFADISLLYINLLTQTFFCYDADGQIVYGTLHLPVCYGVAFWFVLSSCIVQGIHSGKYTRLQRIVLRMAGISLLLAFIVQFFFLRHLMFSYAVGMMSVYLVFFAVELPVYVRIGEATQALSGRKDEAEKAAEKAYRASRAKSNFLANTSHEIRTPMNAILGMNDMIMKGTKDPHIKSASFEIREAGESLLKIINDILDYSRIESGRIEVTKAVCSLGTILAETDALWRTAIEEKDLRFRVSIEETVRDRLYGDRAKVKQILDNLISNACKYTDQGMISIHVSKKLNVQQQQTLVFLVEDTGAGVRNEELEQIFSLFTRAALDENRDKKGAGLGLKIADDLAHLLGGEIRAESVYGKGSRFTLYLPCEEEEQNEAEPEERADLPAKEVFDKERRARQVWNKRRPFRADGMHVLVVDDTVVNLTVIRSMLEEAGATADTVMSGRECLGILGRSGARPCDLVLLDYMMPEMDGIRTLEMIRMIPECEKENLPVIALTASIDESTASFFLQAGFDDYLAKPVKAPQLREMLEKYRGKPRQREENT